MEIGDSARNRGLAKKTLTTLCATRSAWSLARERDLVIGADRAGRRLEIVILDDDPNEEPVVIHAMPLRPKVHDHLR